MKQLDRIRLTLVSGSLLIGKYIFSAIAWRFFPKSKGTIVVKGLETEVHVYRDKWGVPHIYAQNQADLFFAQGYVHAQDRFWQMEYWRHIGQGRAAEIGGKRLVEVDTFIRTMGWNRIAAATLETYKTQAPEYLKIIEAYCAGINSYIEKQRGKLSLNHAIMGLGKTSWEIELWTPIDTLSWGVLLSDSVSASWRDELLYTALSKAIGEEMTNALLPFYPYANRPVIVPTGKTDAEEIATGANRSTFSHLKDTTAAAMNNIPAIDQALHQGPFAGSNNWVVSGKYTNTGMPLLANDPHLAPQMPSIWYEVSLHAPGWDVVGFSFAGVPGVVIGHNNKIGWGVTNVGPDVQDLFIEKLNPIDSNQYEFMGKWCDIEVIREVIKVNGGKDHVLDVQLTHHGPIITKVLEGVDDPLAFNWAGAIPSLALKATLMLNQAQNYEEFQTALEYLHAPSQNMVYADIEGNIAYQMAGRIPIRKSGNGVAPVPGWTGDYEWIGWVPYEELPGFKNPECGYIVTANNAVVDEKYPHLLDLYWSDGNRAQRIIDMLEKTLEQAGSITVDDCARIQLDTISLLAADYVPLLRGLSSDNNRVQIALKYLCDWDLHMHRDSVPAAIFEIFYMHLASLLLKDTLGDAAQKYLTNGDAQRVFFHKLAHQPDANWWKVCLVNGTVMAQEEILLQALTATVQWFDEKFGQNMEKWTWGRFHTVTFTSNPLGRSGIKLLENIVNRGPFAVDGSNSTVNDTGWNWRNRAAAVSNHASMRMIIDMHDFDASLSIHATGQSGHPFHHHYDDFIDLWRNGKYHPMLFGQASTQLASRDHLVFRPESL
jgi:penicillin G amidase